MKDENGPVVPKKKTTVSSFGLLSSSFSHAFGILQGV